MSDHLAAPTTDDLSSALAVVGMAGRFPGAPDLDTFWANLVAGAESVTVGTADELAEAGLPKAVYAHPDYVAAKGRLPGSDLFDAGFFGFNAHEAQMTDPQHRLFLETAWHALEDAAQDPARFAGRIGVYAGQSMNTYLLYNTLHDDSIVPSFYLDYMPMMISANDDFLATRVAYKLDLTGPAMTLQTACSSSLVAIHQAGQALLSGDCDMALAGGVSLIVPESFGHIYREGAGVSPDGHCRAFDSTASGIVGGSGLGIVVLRRLEDAIEAGDVIHAVIRGTAVNNDGGGKSGYTAPSVDGQAQVVADALAVAGVPAETVGLVEAHGTATPLGDPIEVAALTRAYRAETDATGYCALGSVKTNVGHLAAAAGVTGLLKAVLAVREGKIPATLHFREPNPKLALETSPFYVNNKLQEWPGTLGPRRAGVSALGVGGTNAHVILEQPPTRPGSGPSRPWQLLTLSARSANALQATAAQFDARVADGGSLADLAYSTQSGRRAFDHRRAVLCREATDAQLALRAPYESSAARAREVAFVFPGGGSQHVGMGGELYDAEPIFREAVDRCAAIATRHLGYDVRELLRAETDDPVAAERLATSPATMAALFTVEYGLAQLWMAWGLRPSAVLGHSLGEYVAACLAGVFSLEDALATVIVRGRLMDEAAPGGMASVALGESELTPLLGGLSLAAVNAPGQCTVAGPEAEVERLLTKLTADEVACRRLQVRRPAHSAALDPFLERFAEHLAGIGLQAPAVPLLSNVTGTWLSDEAAQDPAYWVRQFRSTVRFGDAAAQLVGETGLALVEVGPGTVLSTLLAANQLSDRDAPLVVNSLPHPRDPRPQQACLLAALGRLWEAGLDVDWIAFQQGETRLRVPLPPYPFERQSYWLRQSGGPAPVEATEPARQADFGAVAHSRPQLLTEFVAPRDVVERAVAASWQALLGFEGIGVHDNFYALGGSSLLTARLAVRLREHFGQDIAVDRLLVADSIAEQAAVVREVLAYKAI
ncbi:type I polyketide synthase [Kribbella sp. NPDC056345]|uniref:type I polyketide synthase n=1 Tax=Kribbella sp. NPDC056345 TaxID=3345789 RepID=UPI0035E34F80